VLLLNRTFECACGSYQGMASAMPMQFNQKKNRDRKEQRFT
jgi:hypothetical protein